MKGLQAHLNKIRSDAAECLLLSNLVGHGKGEMFAKTAEHLNALALEIERTIATNGADPDGAADRDVARVADRGEANRQETNRQEANRQETEEANREETIAADVAAADRQQPARPLRMLPWLAVIVLGAVVGAFLWTTNPAKDDWLVSALKSKVETSAAPQDETKQIIIALLSGQQRDRQLFMQELSALAARLDSLERALGKPRTAGAEMAAPSNKDSGGAETKPPTAEESRTLTPETAAAARQSDGGPSVTGSVPGEPSTNQVPPRRAELDPRKPTIGPLGCTQFRSFDPVSGTYTTLEGRRRPCRE
jgi:BA14K-like protein